jgi:hypothetical protein
MLVRLLDDRGGPLTIRDGGVVEVATGRWLTPTEYTAMAERACAELAALEDLEDSE